MILALDLVDLVYKLSYANLETKESWNLKINVHMIYTGSINWLSCLYRNMLNSIISKTSCAKHCTNILRIQFLSIHRIFLNQNHSNLIPRSELHALTIQKSSLLKNKLRRRENEFEIGFSKMNISNFFIKQKDAEMQQITRFNIDEHYEKVRSQNFGPVLASDAIKWVFRNQGCDLLCCNCNFPSGRRYCFELSQDLLCKNWFSPVRMSTKRAYRWFCLTSFHLKLCVFNN